MNQWRNPLLLAILLLSTALGFAGPIDTLYYICDTGDELYKINRSDGGFERIGDLGVGFVETMA